LLDQQVEIGESRFTIFTRFLLVVFSTNLTLLDADQASTRLQLSSSDQDATRALVHHFSNYRLRIAVYSALHRLHRNVFPGHGEGTQITLSTVISPTVFSWLLWSDFGKDWASFSTTEKCVFWTILSRHGLLLKRALLTTQSLWTASTAAFCEILVCRAKKPTFNDSMHYALCFGILVNK